MNNTHCFPLNKVTPQSMIKKKTSQMLRQYLEGLLREYFKFEHKKKFGIIEAISLYFKLVRILQVISRKASCVN